jgi:hypothetical protein
LNNEGEERITREGRLPYVCRLEESLPFAVIGLREKELLHRRDNNCCRNPLDNTVSLGEVIMMMLRRHCLRLRCCDDDVFCFSRESERLDFRLN